MIRRVVLCAMATLVLTLAACGTTGSATGAGSSNGGRGQVKIGVPF